jgi:hypothetical protein
LSQSTSLEIERNPQHPVRLKNLFLPLSGVRSVAETESNITRFRRCRKIQLKSDLVPINIIALFAIILISALFWLSGSFQYFIYTWIIGGITLGIIDLGWYIAILFNCDHLASITLSECISECSDEDYSWCTNRCREIFGYNP